MKKAEELRYTKAPHRKGGRQITAIDADQIVGHLSTAPERAGEKLSLAWVNPSYQRRGIATTMLNLMRHDLGYTPVGDTALTPEGRKWQEGSGVPAHPNPAVTYHWAPGQAEETADTIQPIQHHMLQAEQFDPETVRQRAYYKERKRRPKRGTQGTLWEGAP